MNTTKILADEISGITVASLPSRPTAPSSFGGRGFTAAEMKAAFDRLPLFIIERFNMLLEDISSDDDDSLSAEIPTGIKEGHSLKQLFYDVENGELAKYFTLGDTSLAEYASRTAERLDSADEKIAVCFSHIDDNVLDASDPASRNPITGGIELW